MSASSSENFKQDALKFLSQFKDLAFQIYSSHCRICGSENIPVSFGWTNSELHEIRFKCAKCKNKNVVEPNKEDFEKAFRKYPKLNGTPDAKMFDGWQMQKLKKFDVNNFSELFTSRNLLLASTIWNAIDRLEEGAFKKFMRITFSANLTQGTRMIGDSSNGGGPSWKINCYWLPRNWQELNFLHYLRNRVTKTQSAINDLKDKLPTDSLNASEVEVFDSKRLLEHWEPESVDYILTDPPYGGEGIQYGELSMLWNLWLGYKQDLKEEIAENPYQSKSRDFYAEGLEAVFAACFDALKAGRWMTVTFNNKKRRVWQQLMESCHKIGFSLIAVTPLNRSAPSLTEHTMNGAPKIDVLLHFQKPVNQTKRKSNSVQKTNFGFDSATIEIVNREISRNEYVKTSKILEALTLEWLSSLYGKTQSETKQQWRDLTVTRINSLLEKESSLKWELANKSTKYDDRIWQTN